MGGADGTAPEDRTGVVGQCDGNMRFKDKIAIVTGSAHGIGRATAKLLAGEGATLVAVDINEPRLAAVAEEIEAAGGQVRAMRVDVLDTQQVEAMFDSVAADCGRVDILVNAVGGSSIIPDGEAKVDELTPDEWDTVVRFNLRGTFLCVRAAVERMKKQGGGKIVNLSSRAARGVSDSSSAYAASKAGITAFTKKVATEVGPYGITCNAVAPALTLSDRIAELWAQKSEEHKQRTIQNIPLRRPAQPEDQAKVIAFLASDDADYVTGVTIDTAGGR